MAIQQQVKGQVKQVKGQVKKVQEGLTTSAHQVFLAGLGVAAVAEEESAKLVDRLVAGGKEGEKAFNRLVARGKKVETEGRKRLEKSRKQVLAVRKKTETRVEGAVERVRGTVDTGIGRLAQRLGIPQRQQIQALADRVAELTRKIDSLQRVKTRAAAR
jgi:poly(hydroxyalkanoate) granule-associated protein